MHIQQMIWQDNMVRIPVSALVKVLKSNGASKWCMDKLGVFHAKQTSVCLDPHLN